MPRLVVTNTAVMTPVTLLKSQEPCQQKHMGGGLKHKICNLVICQKGTCLNVCALLSFLNGH